MEIIILFAVLAVSVALVQENLGLFGGYAGSLRLESSEDIQLSEEKVSITPTGNPDKVDYICRFKLKNLKNRKIAARIGFPLKIKSFADRHEPVGDIRQKTDELVSRYNFIVQEENRVHEVRYFSEDSDGKYDGLFVWDVSFRPNEEKLFLITYSMPMTVFLPNFDFNGKCWYIDLSFSESKRFQYVTETGGSWKGEISKAEFILAPVGFEEHLRELAASRAKEERKEEGLRYPAICRIVKPEGWYEDDEGVIRWEFQNYRPDRPISVEYHFVNIPGNAEDTRRLLSLIEKENNIELTVEDVEDIEDIESIIKSYYGDCAENSRTKDFLESQIWYPRSGKSEVPVHVLNVLKQYKKDIRLKEIEK